MPTNSSGDHAARTAAAKKQAAAPGGKKAAKGRTRKPADQDAIDDATRTPSAVVQAVVHKAAGEATRKAAARAADKTERIERAINAKTARQQERLADKAARQIAAKTARQQKIVAKAVQHAEQLDRLASQLQALDIWTRTEPPGRRPRFSRDQIAATAVRIADADGIAALSMRRLAAELDAGTMTLYHYVRTKDELLSLVTDAVMGEAVLTDDTELPGDWRSALTVIARRTRDVLLAHPWILDITDDPPIGPNSVRHFDQSLQAVTSLPMDLEGRLDVLSAVDEYVFGHCLNHRNNLQPDHGFDDSLLTYVQGLIDSGSYPAIGELADEQGLEGAWARIERNLRDADRFERNLTRLLDGIEAGLDQARPAAGRAAERRTRPPRRD